MVAVLLKNAEYKPLPQQGIKAIYKPGAIFILDF